MSEMKIDLDLTEPMLQFTGQPLKDLTRTALPPTMKRDEYNEIVEKAEPLYKGVFLAQVLDSTRATESLKDLQYFNELAREVYAATMEKLEGKKIDRKVKYEVGLDWLNKVLGHLEKERKGLEQWNNSTYIGQLARWLDKTRRDLENNIERAKSKGKEKAS